MIAFSDTLCREICSAGTVALEISTMEDRRRSGLVQFCAVLAVAAAAAAGLAFFFAGRGRGGLIFALVVLIVVIAGLFGYQSLSKVAEGLKVPVLQAIAGKARLTYTERGFEPPVFAEARPALFGNWLSRQSFRDLFEGNDAQGRRFALYEAVLTRSSGRSRQTIFSGQVWAWQRQQRSGGEIVIVPDRGIFNFFKPVGGMERVRFESDPEFESKFEVYAFEPQQAAMVVGSALRRALLAQRQLGRVFGYIGAEEVLIAGWDRNRFEPGSMFRAIPGEDRVRAMLSDVCGALDTLEELRAALP